MIVVRVPAGQNEGTLKCNGKTYKCWVGEAGLAGLGQKKEGDKKTPVGRYQMNALWVRPDKVNRDDIRIGPVKEIQQDDAWADDVNDPENYNKPVKLPYAHSHEKMWRDDDSYDYVGELDFNRRVVHVGAGSAIFFHIKEGPTAGCIAVSKDDMIEIIRSLVAKVEFDIGPA